jgi:acyl transferase domain-containing protein
MTDRHPSDDHAARLRRAALALDRMQRELDAAERARSEPIAIVGLGCRFPGGASDPDAYWRLLRDGVDAIREVPGERWDAGRYHDPDPQTPGTTPGRHGAFLHGIDRFDPQFFGIAPREANAMDPQHRLLLEVAWEALEHAGIAATALRGTRGGVFIGLCVDDYASLGLRGGDPTRITAHDASGNALAFGAGRLSYVLGLHGPSLVLDTACSSSLVAVHLACRSLRAGECDLALAGGVQLNLTPEVTICLARTGALAPDGRCKTFDAAADGFGRGEGCGVVVLKRLSDAVAEGDTVLAVVAGSAVNHDGPSSGLTVPNERAQETLIRQALADARVTPDAVDYVEAHGTGTTLGDPIELGALASVFAPGRPADRPLVVGSVKTNVGHLEAAAGVAGLMKVVLALRHGSIPPHLHFTTPTPHVPWSRLPFRVPAAGEPWPAGARPRVAGVSAFGMSGTNAHVIVREAPAPPPAPVATPVVTLLPLSAKTGQALGDLAGRYRDALAADATLAPGDVASTAAVGRAHFDHRLAVVARSREELLERLEAGAAGRGLAGLVRGRVPDTGAPRVAFLFSGQGAQHAGMGETLYATQPVFRRALDRCAELLRPRLDRDLREVLFDGGDVLAQTVHTQPALFALEWALAETWRALGVVPDVVLGHSIGEYVAACVAGVFALEDGLALVAERARLMQALAHPGEMAAVLAAFERVLRRTPMAAPRIRLVSNLTGDVAGAEIATPEYWLRHLLDPVRFGAGVARLVAAGVGAVVEIGPQATLIDMARQCVPDRDVVWLASQRAAPETAATQAFLTAVAELYVRGVAIDWRALHEGPRRRVALPTYPFQRRRCWVSAPSTPVGPPPREASAPRPAPAGDHPWLADRGATAGRERVFDVKLHDDAARVLRDHVVLDRPIMPLAAWLDALVAAGAIALDGRAVRIERLVLGAPLALDAPGPVQLVVAREQDGTASFHGASRAAASSWTIHVTGRVTTADRAEDRACLDVEALRRALSDEMPVDRLYARYEALGVRFGPSFRTLERVWRRDGEALARIRLPEGVAAAGFAAHPVLLDGALQALLAAVADDGDTRTFLPVSVDAVRAHGPLPPALWAHATLRSSTGAARVADFALVDDTGAVIVAIERFLAREAEEGAARRRDDGAIHALRWSARPRAVPGERREPMRSTRAEAGRWLILADRTGVAAALAAELARAGETVVLRFAADGGETDRVVSVVDAGRAPGAALSIDIGGALDAHDGDAYRRALADGSPWRGVVHCWGLDVPALDGDWERGQRPACESVLLAAQALDTARWTREEVARPRLWIVTRGAQPAGREHGLLAVEQATLWGLGRALDNELALGCALVDLDPAVDASDVTTLGDELLAPDGELQIAIRSGERLVPRLEPIDLPGPGPSGVRLRLGGWGSFEDLALVRAPRAAETPPGHVEIDVRAAALNLKDVLYVLGMLRADAEARGFAAAGDVPLGFECAGTVAAVGAGVTGVAIGEDVVAALTPGALASRVTVRAEHVVPKPDTLGFEDAATLPVAFLTAHHALHGLAALRPGEHVLIHAAAGGVGQAAVQLARRAGAIVLATASPAKWSVLRAQGVAHVMTSRDTTFAEEVLRVTGGRGVDVVVNSLKADFVRASLTALAPGGRFVELGLLSGWDAARVRAERPDVAYLPLQLDEIAARDPAGLSATLRAIVADVAAGALAPLPRTVFPLAEAAEAFRFMGRARNVGKVVVTMSGVPAFRREASYLVTGGLGGIGLVVAEWLADRGAGHVVLAGRRPPSLAAAEAITRLEKRGVVVTVERCDVADRGEVEALLARVRAACPPLRGIVHAAGALDDAPLAQQSWARVRRALAGKAAGAWHLHALTRELPLDHFICVSSAAAVLGSPAQANYAAANAVLATLVAARRALGLAGLVVDWGPWDAIGMTATLGAAWWRRLREHGVRPLAVTEALAALDRLVDANAAHAMVLSADWPSLRATLHGRGVRRVLDGVAPAAPAPASWAAAPAASSPLAPATREDVEALVTREVAHVLGLAPGDPIGRRDGFFDLGMDSLLSMELRNRLERALAVALAPTVAFDFPTVEALTGHLATDVLALVPSRVSAPAPGPERPAVPEDLSALSDDDLAALLAAELGATERPTHG